MKHRLSRLSPHQNAKVLGVLMALSSLIIAVPFSLVMMIAMPAEMHAGLSVGMVIMLPVVYLVMGYIGAIVSCFVYNLVVRMVGGFEYETTPAGE